MTVRHTIKQSDLSSFAHQTIDICVGYFTGLRTPYMQQVLSFQHLGVADDATSAHSGQCCQLLDGFAKFIAFAVDMPNNNGVQPTSVGAKPGIDHTVGDFAVVG